MDNLTRRLRRGLLAPLLLVPLCSCGGGSKLRPLLPIERMADYSWMPVTIEGTLRKAYMSDDSCLYAEWAAGPFNPDASGEFEPIYQSSDSIVVVTPHGILPIDIFSIRLYLRPTLSRTYSPENAKMAPMPVQDAIERSGGGITAVREYILRPTQTYYARVGLDSLSATGSSSEAGETVAVTRRILEISDRPFDVARLSDITPATR